LNLKAVYELAAVLTKSQIRGTQRNRTLARIFDDPRIILAVDAAAILGLGTVGYLVLSTQAAIPLRSTVAEVEPQALAGIPSAIMFMMILFGVLYEISQPIQSLSTDLVNWLPISPLEYVGASTLSEVYIYSFMLCILLGLILGPALLLSMGSLWVATAFMAIVALFIGACVVEVLDAITNRISSSFYKKSGRSGIVFRLAITVTILVFIQLLFSGYVIGYLLQSALHAASMAWFVPVVWPSLAILGLSEANTVSFAAFSALSLAFAACMLVLAAEFRARFWVPVPVSIKLTARAYRPGKISLPFLGGVESALIQKDLRSLTRRREMARFLAIPFVLAVSMIISMLPITTQTSQAPGFATTIFVYFIPIAIFVDILSMTSIGQEGPAVWNLYAAPIRPSQLLRAKLLFASILGLAFGFALLAVFAFILPDVGAFYWMLLPLGAAVVFEESALGVYFAARFPDFREMVRSRYVGVWGQLTGILVSLIVAGVILAPITMYFLLYGVIEPEPVIASLVLAVVLFVMEWRLANREVSKLLQNIRV
jgi:hypothetical protein